MGVYDVITDDGFKIEVKAASYSQTWNQHSFSKIRFDIKPTKAWNVQTGEYSKNKGRSADVYVFCLLHHKDQKTLKPLHLSQWSFFVISTEQLNDQVGQQKSISLSSLRNIGAEKAKFKNLKQVISTADS